MTNLSPAAEAVYDAFICTPVECETKQALATALRAAADQVAPDETAPIMMRGHELERLAQRHHTRSQLLAIAAELEGAQ